MSKTLMYFVALAAIQLALLYPSLEGKIVPKDAADDALAALEEVASARLTALQALVDQLKQDLNDATDADTDQVAKRVAHRLDEVVEKIKTLRTNTEPMQVDTSKCDEAAADWLQQLTEKSQAQLDYCTELSRGENADLLDEALNDALVAGNGYLYCGRQAVAICAGAEPCSDPVVELVNGFAKYLPKALDAYQANVQNIRAVSRSPCADLVLGQAAEYAANIMRNTAICYNTAVVTFDKEPLC